MSYVKVRPNQKEHILQTFSTALPLILTVTQDKKNVLVDNLYRCRKTFVFEDGEKIYMPKLLPDNTNLYQFISIILCETNFDEPIKKKQLVHIHNACELMSKSLLLDYKPHFGDVIQDLQKVASYTLDI